MAAENFLFFFSLFGRLVCAWKVKIDSNGSFQTFDLVVIGSERNCEKEF